MFTSSRHIKGLWRAHNSVTKYYEQKEKKKRKKLLPHVVIYIDLENIRLLHNKQNKNFELT